MPIDDTHLGYDLGVVMVELWVGSDKSCMEPGYIPPKGVDDV